MFKHIRDYILVSPGGPEGLESQGLAKQALSFIRSYYIDVICIEGNGEWFLRPKIKLHTLCFISNDPK